MADLSLTLRSQRLTQDAEGRNFWQVREVPALWPAERTALLICDMWDNHWSRGAVLRVNELAPRVDAFARALRERGAHIIHAPSDTADLTADTPARRRMLAVPRVEPPPSAEHPDPPQPVDASDGGSDTNHGDETVSDPVWTRQHPAVFIDQVCERDVISDDGMEIYSYLVHHGLEHLILTGVHTGMCVLGRSFGIRQMVRWGVDTVLTRDLTDTVYNPARPPYVSHQEGTRLVAEYIEKFWRPTVEGAKLLA